MKANELMIGDWVIFGDEPLKVQHVYNNGYDDVVAEITEESFNEYGVCEEIRDVPSVNCSPIPLTPEILEKNGWERDIDKEWKYNNSHIFPHYCYQWEKRNVRIEMYAGLEGFTISLIIGRRFYAVHELQHALRLYGLDELADNFKV